MNTKNKTTKKYINGITLKAMIHDNPLTQELSDLMSESDRFRIKLASGTGMDNYVSGFMSKYKIKNNKENKYNLMKDLDPAKSDEIKKEEDRILKLFRSFYEKMHKEWEDIISGKYAIDVNYLKVKDYYMRLRMIFFEELSLFGNHKAHNEVVNSR